MTLVQKIIYVHKISKEGPEFPKEVKVSGLSFSFLYNDKTWVVKYLPSREYPDEVYLYDGGLPNAPPRGDIDFVLNALFSEVPFGEALVETEDPLPSPLLLKHACTRQTPDYLATVRSCPSISLAPSECEDPLIPWRYRLPGEEDWVELDALGVKSMGFHEELVEYLKGGQ